MKRREFMSVGVAGSMAATLAALARADRAEAAAPKIEPALKIRRAKRPLLINRPRAEKEMTKVGLDAMIVRDPSNVFYATNHWSLFSDYGSMQPSFAVIPRDQNKPIICVAPWVEMRKLVSEEAEYGQMIIYDPRAATKDGRNRFNNQKIADGYEMGPLEKAWIESAEKYWPDAVATSNEGVIKALKELGLTRGRLGVDDMRIVYDLKSAGFEGPTLVEQVPVMYRIRQVKTAPEIALLREAAQLSADCAYAVAARIDVGATAQDMRWMYREEAAKRGGGYINLAVGWEDLPFKEVEKNKPFMIDGVASIERYVGDFGRTIVVGDPDTKTEKTCKSTGVAWEAVYEHMTVGRRFSELGQFARAAVEKAGLPIAAIGAGAHSVGLQHSEDPMNAAGGKEADFVMEPGMVLSVDHPYIELGWGSSHLEDLTLITENGPEPLNKHSAPLIVT